MGKRRASPEPELEGRFSTESRRSCERREVGSSGAEFIPKGARRVAREAHCPGLPEEDAVNIFGATIDSISRSRGGCQLLVDAMRRTPAVQGFGDKFIIVDDENAKLLTRLCLHVLLPGLKHRSGLVRTSQGQAPDVTGEVVDDVHGIQTPRTGNTGHWTNKIDVDTLQRT